ncbi:MAG: PQQ-binding-like beta-propeller repeat protein [Thermoplasmata archaeon]|nr:PQQ-binding-like beta-propeller repeat protein [Thermoplasmata archaeon]
MRTDRIVRRALPGAVGVVVLVLLIPGLPGSSAVPAAPTPHPPGVGTIAAANAAGPRPASGAAYGPTGSWATYLGSPEHTGANLLEPTISASNVSNLSELWEVATNGSVLSAPIVVGNSVYFGTWEGNEVAANRTTGAIEWSTYLGSDPSCFSPGIDSTPTYDNGTLYLGAPNGSWDALNASRGTLDWSYPVGNTSDGYYDWSSAEVFRQSLYIGIASCNDHPQVRGGVLELNLSGSPSLNHSWYTVAPGAIGSSVWATPTVDPAADILWVATGNDNGTDQPYAESVVALNASTLGFLGSWQVPGVVGDDSDFGSTPTLAETPTGVPIVVSTNKDHVTYAFDRDNVTASGWSPIWTQYTGGGVPSGAFDGTRLFFAGARGSSPGTLMELDPSNGTIVWQTPLAGQPLGAISYAHGLVFDCGGHSEYADDAQNGTILWRFSPPDNESVVGEAVVLDGRVYVPTGDLPGESGHLYAFGVPLGVAISSAAPGPATPWVGSFRAAPSGGSPPYRVVWSFDNATGPGVPGPTVNHTFETPGVHVVVARVTDSAGATYSGFETFSIALAPLDVTANATVGACSTSGLPRNVTFAASAGGGWPAYTYSWTFPGGSTATGPRAGHAYTASPYTAVLVVLDHANESVVETVGPGPTTLANCSTSVSPGSASLGSGLWENRTFWEGVGAGAVAVAALGAAIWAGTRWRGARTPRTPPEP